MEMGRRGIFECIRRWAGHRTGGRDWPWQCRLDPIPRSDQHCTGCVPAKLQVQTPGAEEEWPVRETGDKHSLTPSCTPGHTYQPCASARQDRALRGREKLCRTGSLILRSVHRRVWSKLPFHWGGKIAVRWLPGGAQVVGEVGKIQARNDLANVTQIRNSAGPLLLVRQNSLLKRANVASYLNSTVIFFSFLHAVKCFPRESKLYQQYFKVAAPV